MRQWRPRHFPHHHARFGRVIVFRLDHDYPELALGLGFGLCVHDHAQLAVFVFERVVVVRSDEEGFLGVRRHHQLFAELLVQHFAERQRRERQQLAELLVLVERGRARPG